MNRIEIMIVLNCFRKERKKELSTPVASRSASLQRPLTKNGSSSQLSRPSPAVRFIK